MHPSEPPDQYPRPKSPKKHRRAIGIVVAIIAIALVMVGSFVTVPRRTIRPGDAVAMSSLVRIVDGERTQGNIYLLTVKVGNRDMNLFEQFWAEHSDDVEIVDTKKLLQGFSDEEDQCLAKYEMVDSQSQAQLAAAHALGSDISGTEQTVVVLKVFKGMPAARVLNVCDVITEIDGNPIESPEDVTKYVQAHKRGDVAEVTVNRDGTTSTVDVRVTEITDKDGSKRPGIGIGPVAVLKPDSLPLGVEINSQNVTGPSGGLGFTLEIIDQLSSGDLAGRKDIAVTGTIAGDGTVGAIGGAQLKAVTARNAGADYMIVPNEDLKDAKKGAGSMKVYGVATLKQALAVLRKNGGEPIGKTVPTSTASTP